MELNPYEAPALTEPAPLDGPKLNEGHAGRPKGIWILAGIHILAGLFFLSLTALLLWQFTVGNGVRLPFPFWFAAAACSFVGTLGLATGIGIWLGTRWGWWLTAFYYVWGTLGAAGDVVRAILRTEELDTSEIVVILLCKSIPLAI